MPPLPRIHLALFRDAVRSTQKDPARLRQVLSAAFDLSRDLDPAQSYPVAWFTFRLGLTIEPDPAAMVKGSELLTDLSALVETLTDSARFTRADVSEGWQTLDDLAKSWKVSRKTVDRYRKKGLLAWRIRDHHNKPVLLIEPGHAADFAVRNQGSMARAAGFDRIDAKTQARMLRRAAVYRARFGCTLNQTAERLAHRFGRSREAVRAVLRRGQSGGGKPVFTEPDTLSDREARLCYRAVQRGIDPSLLARRFRKPMGSIRRGIGLTQLRLIEPHAAGLRGLDDSSLTDGQISMAMASPPVLTGLHVRAHTDLADFLEDASGPYSSLAIEESTRAAAYRGARVLAARKYAALNHNFPGTIELDEIITLLRWASRLKAWLMRSQFRLCVQTLEATFGTPLTGLKSADALALTGEMLGLLSDLVDQHTRSEPRGRLAAPVGLAMNKLAGKWLKDRLRTAPGKAAARATTRPSGRLDDWTTRLNPWQPALDPPRWLRGVLPGLAVQSRELLVLRFGWDDAGSPPRTLDECMKILGWSRIRAVRAERAAMHEALTLIRRGGVGASSA